MFLKWLGRSWGWSFLLCRSPCTTPALAKMRHCERSEKPAFLRPFACVEASLPRHVELCAEREREGLSTARTCTARVASCSAKPSISPPSRQTFWPSPHPFLCPSFASQCGLSIYFLFLPVRSQSSRGARARGTETQRIVASTRPKRLLQRTL